MDGTGRCETGRKLFLSWQKPLYSSRDESSDACALGEAVNRGGTTTGGDTRPAELRKINVIDAWIIEAGMSWRDNWSFRDTCMAEAIGKDELIPFYRRLLRTSHHSPMLSVL